MLNRIQKGTMMGNNGNDKTEERSGLIIGGSIMIGVGILFLLVNLDLIPGFRDMWPIFIIIVGLALIIGSIVRGKKKSDI
jgi:hypothetical protein